MMNGKQSDELDRWIKEQQELARQEFRSRQEPVSYEEWEADEEEEQPILIWEILANLALGAFAGGIVVSAIALILGIVVSLP